VRYEPQQITTPSNATLKRAAQKARSPLSFALGVLRSRLVNFARAFTHKEVVIMEKLLIVGICLASAYSNAFAYKYAKQDDYDNGYMTQYLIRRDDGKHIGVTKSGVPGNQNQAYKSPAGMFLNLNTAAAKVYGE
jgi:hypothetical protein